MPKVSGSKPTACESGPVCMQVPDASVGQQTPRARTAAEAPEAAGDASRPAAKRQRRPRRKAAAKG